MADEEEKKENFFNKISMVLLIIAIVFFLVITNYRLTKTQQTAAELKDKLNEMAAHQNSLMVVGTESAESIPELWESIAKVWDTINIIKQLNFEWWVKKHNINVTNLGDQMNLIDANCSLKEPIDNNYIEAWTDHFISLQLNSSAGEIIVNYFNDGTIKCERQLWDSQNISCQKLCSEGENGEPVKVQAI